MDEVYNIVKVLNVTKLFTLKWPILCYVNFTSIKRNSRTQLNEIQKEIQEKNVKHYKCKTNKISNYQNIRNLKMEKNLVTMRPEYPGPERV